MPVSIGDVHSEVLVDAPSQEGGSSEAENKLLLPTLRELDRWRQLQQRQQSNHCRTAARDFDD